MKSVHMRDIQRPTAQDVFATQLLEGDKSNVRLIRIAPGEALPPHRHGVSDLMLFAAEGDGILDLPEGPVKFGAGALAFYRGDEELRVRNTGSTDLTLLAFLAPKFPPVAGQVKRSGGGQRFQGLPSSRRVNPWSLAPRRRLRRGARSRGAPARRVCATDLPRQSGSRLRWHATDPDRIASDHSTAMPGRRGAAARTPECGRCRTVFHPGRARTTGRPPCPPG